MYFYITLSQIRDFGKISVIFNELFFSCRFEEREKELHCLMEKKLSRLNVEAGRVRGACNEIINSLAIERLAFRAANSRWQPVWIYPSYKSSFDSYFTFHALRQVPLKRTPGTLWCSRYGNTLSICSVFLK